MGEGKVCLLASRPGQKAMEVEKLGGGLFTHYLLEGLAGAAQGALGERNDRVSVQELGRYLQAVVPEKAGEAGHVQNPQIKVDSPGEVFLTKPAKP